MKIIKCQKMRKDKCINLSISILAKRDFRESFMDEIVSVKERILGGKNCSRKDIDMACSKTLQGSHCKGNL